MFFLSILTVFFKRFMASKLTRLERRNECWIEPGPSSLNVLDSTATVISQYDYKDIKRVLTVSDQVGFVFIHAGRGRLFLCQERDSVLAHMRTNAVHLGVELKVTGSITWDKFCEGVTLLRTCNACV
jgi:hypothetical protein